MAGERIYVRHIGLPITIDMGTDISDATTTNILVRKKGGDATWTATVGSDSRSLEYTTVEDDIDVAGTYYLQPYIVTPSYTAKGKTVTMEVYEAYK